MNRRRALAALGVAAALALSTTACVASGDVDADYGSSSDVADCDAEDRRKKEIPDCGRKVNDKYREWSWVAAGKTRPPAGWRASQEKTTSTGSSPKPKTTTGKKTTTTGGGDTRKSTNRSGTTRRR